MVTLVIKKLLSQQYELVKSSRNVVNNYLINMPESYYIKEIEYFGKGSIRNTQVHIANTYTYWLENYAQQSSLDYFQNELIQNVENIKSAFKRIDEIVANFLEIFSNDFYTTLNLKLPKTGKHYSTSPLNLFTHVVTHEFHHKGQILSMGRTLGFIPPDADAIRFE
jgi:uncharacterized damage-inducible protein DinB